LPEEETLLLASRAWTAAKRSGDTSAGITPSGRATRASASRLLTRVPWPGTFAVA
jgi:hypothetical protein